VLDINNMSREQKQALEDYKFLISQMRVAGHNIEAFDITNSKHINDMNIVYEGLFDNVII
jgi:hypothetical protein